MRIDKGINNLHERLNGMNDNEEIDTGSSSLGRKYCCSCILFPSRIPSLHSQWLFNVVMAEFDYCDISKPDLCNVVNIFECPYAAGHKFNTSSLLQLGLALEILQQAFEEAYWKTDQYYYARFEINFATGEIIHVHYDGGYESFELHPGKIEAMFSDLNIPTFPARFAEEVFDILMDKNKLDSLLTQYLRQECIQYKEGLVHLLTKFKDRISLDAIRTVMQSKSEFTGHNACVVGHDQIEYELAVLEDKKRLLCASFANIHCVGCDIWLCKNHIKKHQNGAHIEPKVQE